MDSFTKQFNNSSAHFRHSKKRLKRNKCYRIAPFIKTCRKRNLK